MTDQELAQLETLQVVREGAVDWVTLNRPDRLNAITATMVRELFAYFEGLRHNYDTRVVVLRGAGRGFCAGLDIIEENKGEDAVGTRAPTRPREAHLAGIIHAMRACPQPIIALVHGPACGGGFAFALASDIRIAGASARMNDAFIRIGMSGCELGLSYFLPRMVGLSIASELMMTGNFIEAERAAQVGLVSRVVPDEGLEQAARDLIAAMLRTTPMGLRKTKQTLNTAMKLLDLEAVIALEEHTQMACTQTADFDEALRAFAEKRPPRFALQGG
ncbi:enoyl-CoA hydratase/isomerase family protein [Zavarzinia sp. CC-PAN008]|uniref:enoyl-CoA hydratase/isomerase family protein n=1 Tax=Zavarzinia sp. CC-PAN008 TaxID=3243332 RepID=UPI003F74726C